jgi:hypothetical protein
MIGKIKLKSITVSKFLFISLFKNNFYFKIILMCRYQK